MITGAPGLDLEPCELELIEVIMVPLDELMTGADILPDAGGKPCDGLFDAGWDCILIMVCCELDAGTLRQSFLLGKSWLPAVELRRPEEEI